MSVRPELSRNARLPCDALVHLASAARLNDDVFDFTDTVALVPAGQLQRYQFHPKVLGRWERLGREVAVILGNPTHPAVAAAGLHLRPADRLNPQTIVARLRQIKALAEWAADTGRGLPATWAQPDCDAFVEALRAGTLPDASSRRTRRYERRPAASATITRYVAILRSLHTCRAALSDGGLAFEPWPGTSPAAVARHTRAEGCLTAISPPEQLLPLLAAADLYVSRLAADILPAWERACAIRQWWQEHPSGRGARLGYAALAAFDRWAADPANFVPVHAPGSGVVESGRAAPGTPNWNVLCAEVGIFVRRGPNMPEPDRQLDRRPQSLVDAGRVRVGIHTPTVRLERGEIWCDHLDANTLDREAHALQCAAYILCAALTGQRVSELRDWERDTLGTWYGTPALRTRLHKHASGEEHWWWVSDDVVRAYEVIGRISSHPTYLFTPLHRANGRHGVSHPEQWLRWFADHVNSRARLGLTPVPTDPELSPQVLRHTLARIGAATPGGELALALMYKHARACTTASYMAIRPDDPWATQASTADLDQAVEILEGLAARLEAALLAGPAAGDMREMLREYRALVLTDDRAARHLLRQTGADYHLGALNDCRYDAGQALCRKDVPPDIDVPPGPLLGACHTVRCPNAVVTSRHIPVWISDRDTSTAALRTPGLSPPRRAALRARLDESTRVLNDLGVR